MLHNINNLRFCIRVHVFLNSFNTASYEPRHEEICIRGLRQGKTQNWPYSHRSYIAEDKHLVLNRKLVSSDMRNEFVFVRY